MAIRVTADTNIYISALNFGGMPERVLTLARNGLLELAISDAILSEIARVLTVKFRWASGPVRDALLEIAAYTKRIKPTKRVDVVLQDPTDNRILECAIEASSEWIVSGDTHLLQLVQHAGIRILTPSEFFDLFREQLILSPGQ